MGIIEEYKTKYNGCFNGATNKEKASSILDRYSVKDNFYREWLSETNGGPIGPDWYDGVSELEESQAKLASELWNIKGFVIGWDGAGNPIVMLADNSIATEDHDSGGIHRLAKNFKSLLTIGVSI